MTGHRHREQEQYFHAGIIRPCESHGHDRRRRRAVPRNHRTRATPQTSMSFARFMANLSIVNGNRGCPGDRVATTPSSTTRRHGRTMSWTGRSTRTGPWTACSQAAADTTQHRMSFERSAIVDRVGASISTSPPLRRGVQADRPARLDRTGVWAPTSSSATRSASGTSTPDGNTEEGAIEEEDGHDARTAFVRARRDRRRSRRRGPPRRSGRGRSPRRVRTISSGRSSGWAWVTRPSGKAVRELSSGPRCLPRCQTSVRSSLLRGRRPTTCWRDQVPQLARRASSQSSTARWRTSWTYDPTGSLRRAAPPRRLRLGRARSRESSFPRCVAGATRRTPRPRSRCRRPTPRSTRSCSCPSCSMSQLDVARLTQAFLRKGACPALHDLAIDSVTNPTVNFDVRPEPVAGQSMRYAAVRVSSSTIDTPSTPRPRW